MSLTSKLFQGGAHAKLYAQFRPVYPPSVLSTILEYCKQSKCDQKAALDIGCGSGQSTLALSKHFPCVVGADVSKAQVDQAPKDIPGLSFLVSPAENLSFQCSQSVDLVTVAQAIHWIDLDKFYSEVDRVLRPGGVLAVYGYGNVKLCSKEASDMVHQFYSKTLDGYWAADRKHIDDHYKKIYSPPFGTYIRDDSQLMSKVMPLSAFIGYLSSWSAYRTLLAENPQTNALETLYQRLLGIYNQVDRNNDASDPTLEASWPLFILLCAKHK